MTRRRWLEPASSVRELRARLELTQAELAERLGVARRTVIRGELRGLELPYWGPRAGVRERWRELKAAASDPRLNVTPRTVARKVSRGPRKRLRLSRELLESKKRPRKTRQETRSRPTRHRGMAEKRR